MSSLASVSRTKLACLILASVVAFSLTALAQTEAASINGRVSDPHGLSVVGAKISVVNINTGVVLTTQSNGSGFYNVNGLPTGTYRLMVEKEGFAKVIKPDIEHSARPGMRTNSRASPPALAARFI